MNKKHYAIAVNKLQRIDKGKNKGKYKTVLIHSNFYGTWEELEEYLEENHYVLIGYDCIEEV
jgi:hypothetical protein